MPEMISLFLCIVCERSLNMEDKEENKQEILKYFKLNENKHAVYLREATKAVLREKNLQHFSVWLKRTNSLKDTNY